MLFFVEGFTDIRFVVGLSEMCDLTMAVPAGAYVESTLKERVKESGARLKVHEIEGDRLAFQARSFAYLWEVAPNFDVILSQEVLRGSLNATITGVCRGVPVVTTMAISPVEYFRAGENVDRSAPRVVGGRVCDSRADGDQREARHTLSRAWSSSL